MNTKESAIDELFEFVKYKAEKRRICFDKEANSFEVVKNKKFTIKGRRVSADIAVYSKIGSRFHLCNFFYVVSTDEVEHTKEMVRNFRKDVKNPYCEVFIFDYEKRVWHAIKGMNNGGYPDASFSYTLDEDFTYYFTDTTSGDLELVEVEKEKSIFDYRFYKLSWSIYQDYIMKFYFFFLKKKKMIEKKIGKECGTQAYSIGLFKDGQGPVFDMTLSRKITNHFEEDVYPYILIDMYDTESKQNEERKIKKVLSYYEGTEIGATLECYFYDIEADKWHSYGPNANPARPSYSKLLDIDLTEALKADID